MLKTKRALVDRETAFVERFGSGVAALLDIERRQVVEAPRKVGVLGVERLLADRPEHDDAVVLDSTIASCFDFDRSCWGGIGAIYGARPRAVTPRRKATMKLPPPLVEIHGDDVTVEATYLAARLGLPVERLRTEMRRGIVYGVVERGIGEDEGRLDQTVRYRTRGGAKAVRDAVNLRYAPSANGRTDRM